MYWQLPDIGKTITNNILPSNFTQYVSGDTTILSIGGSRLFLCISVSRYSLIRIGLYKVVVLEIIKPISEKIDSTAWTTWVRFKRLIQPTQPSSYNYPEKNTCLTSSCTNEFIYEIENWRRGPSLYYCQMMNLE